MYKNNHELWPENCNKKRHQHMCHVVSLYTIYIIPFPMVRCAVKVFEWVCTLTSVAIRVPGSQGMRL